MVLAFLSRTMMSIRPTSVPGGGSGRPLTLRSSVPMSNSRPSASMIIMEVVGRVGVEIGAVALDRHFAQQARGR